MLLPDPRLFDFRGIPELQVSKIIEFLFSLNIHYPISDSLGPETISHVILDCLISVVILNLKFESSFTLSEHKHFYLKLNIPIPVHYIALISVLSLDIKFLMFVLCLNLHYLS